MSSDLFRRDQVWFTQKRDDGATELVCLDEYGEVRGDTNFERWYRQGRFEAVPQIREVADAIVAWQNTLSHAQKAAHVANLRKTHPPRKTTEAAAVAPSSAPTPPAETAAPAAQPEGAAAPLCPKCGVPMVLRHRKSDGGDFWGCPNYPSCRSIVNISE